MTFSVRLKGDDAARFEALTKRLGVGPAIGARMILSAGMRAVERDPAYLVATPDPGQHRAVLGAVRDRAVPPLAPPDVDDLTPTQRQRAQELGLLPPQA